MLTCTAFEKKLIYEKNKHKKRCQQNYRVFKFGHFFYHNQKKKKKIKPRIISSVKRTERLNIFQINYFFSNFPTGNCACGTGFHT